MLFCELTECAHVAGLLILGASFSHPVSYNTKISDVNLKGKCFCVLMSYEALYQQQQEMFLF